MTEAEMRNAIGELGELKQLRSRVAELERERDNANAALKLATGLCDELESRASAAEQRVKRLEGAIREAIISMPCGEFTMWHALNDLRAALAASEAEAPAREATCG